MRQKLVKKYYSFLLVVVIIAVIVLIVLVANSTYNVYLAPSKAKNKNAPVSQSNICSCENSAVCNAQKNILSDKCITLKQKCGVDCSGVGTSTGSTQCGVLNNQLSNERTTYNSLCGNAGCGPLPSCCASGQTGACCSSYVNGSSNCVGNKTETECFNIGSQPDTIGSIWNEGKSCNQVHCEDIGACCVINRLSHFSYCNNGITQQNCTLIQQQDPNLRTNWHKGKGCNQVDCAQSCVQTLGGYSAPSCGQCVAQIPGCPPLTNQGNITSGPPCPYTWCTPVADEYGLICCGPI